MKALLTTINVLVAGQPGEEFLAALKGSSTSMRAARAATPNEVHC